MSNFFLKATIIVLVLLPTFCWSISAKSNCEKIIKDSAKIEKYEKIWLKVHCEKIEIKGKDESDIFDFVARVKKQFWKGYPWTLNRKDWIGLTAAQSAAEKRFEKSTSDVVQSISKSLIEKEFTPDAAFLKFVIRLFPCFDGESAQTFASILNKVALEKPEWLLMGLLEEQKIISKNSDSCIEELTQVYNDPVLVRSTLTNLSGEWPKNKAPQEFKTALLKLKPQFRDVELIPVFQMVEVP